MTLSPSSGTAARGSASATKVQVNSVSGYAYQVTLYSLNAPPGVTVTFTPSQVTPTASSLAVFSISTGATPGTYTIVVEGVGADGQHASVAYTLTIT
jgi:aminopeptidase S